MASSVFQNTDEAIVENGSSAAAVVADRGGGRERERESFPSLLNRVGYVRRSESEGERVCQSDEERKEGEGRKGRREGGLDDSGGDGGRFGVRAKSH